MGNTVPINNRGKVIFNQKYEMVELIGQGAAADVYMAKTLDPEDENLYAIKIFYR